ncbi:MAG: helix-turn-helix transcriptional regulator [Pseudomonas sp.]|uniref:helix-turn-helix domain-containing protein n=1 Tax=Pseudomonas abieticivorans TaxID=2931382 RepID=UPI0020BE0748|nr:helix-turn-helix transcriptional regulator [Pseudomonas sp. PIA16]MDE1168824.1 helix-turn-helix transcriptional regulator [Pseudomonas sp.]
MREYLPANLQLLCRHYPSIAEVCRRLDINRAQFNKYLNGQSLPTPYNLKRICDFFGVEEYEIGLPAEQFARLIGVRSKPSTEQSEATAPQRILDHLRQRSSSELAAHVGYYHEYYHSMSAPGHILCSLVHLREEGGHYTYERSERLQTRTGKGEEYERYRYLGVAYYLQNRLFFMDYESLTSNEICQTVLIPSYKSRITRLNGLKIGVSSNDQRTPACSRVVWEYLGEQVNRVSAYRKVRLYRPDDPEIDADLRERLAQTQVVDGLFQIG